MKPQNYLIKSFVRFSQGSLLSAVIDFSIFSLMFNLSGNILLAIIVGRLISASFNYFYNHKIAFKSGNAVKTSLMKYIFLVIAVMFCAYLGILFMHHTLHVNVYLSKIIIEFLLFLINFFIQKYFIFN